MLEISNLVKNYGRKTALQGVSLKVVRGETVVIMGPSGCGKSTLIRCVNRLTEPDGGQVKLGSTEMTSLKMAELLAVRRKIGFVFQHFNLVKRLNTLDNVSFSLRMHGVDLCTAREKAALVLKRVGLAHKLTEKPEELSGGEQQRVGIARALALEPEIMLWDEPTASLDPIMVGEVVEVMEELVREGKTTMVIVTHELSFAKRAADRIIFMEKGRIVEEGLPERVFAEPLSNIGKKYRQLLLAG